jgi:hypothetical protein
MPKSLARSVALVAWMVAAASSASHAQSWLRVEVAAGGGFVGTPGAVVVSRPAVDCDADNECVTVEGQVDLLADNKRVWRPALATGVVFRIAPSAEPEDTPEVKDTKFGVGLGGQMVFTPQGDGTRLLPALTVHAGTKATQLFFGLLFGSFDKVEFPNGAETIRVSAEGQPPFVRPNADGGPGLFVGVIIDGAAVTK